jgi:hypothetical protein
VRRYPSSTTSSPAIEDYRDVYRILIDQRAAP